jgi:hypothetical protein
MRLIISAAIAAAAICGMSMNAMANEPIHYAGGPIQDGNMCWVSTNNDNGFGYWKTCPSPMKHHKK